MTPTSSSSSIVLLNPAAQNAKAGAGADGQAAPDAGLSGFELLLGAVRQALSSPASSAGSDTDAPDPKTAPGGKALPQSGTTLPLSATDLVPGHAQLSATNAIKLRDGVTDADKQIDGEVASCAAIGADVGSAAIDNAAIDSKELDAKALNDKKTKDKKSDSADEAMSSNVPSVVLTPVGTPPKPAAGDASVALAAAAMPTAAQVPTAAKKQGADSARAADITADAAENGAAVRADIGSRANAITGKGSADALVANTAPVDTARTDASLTQGAGRASQSDFDTLVKHFEAPVRNQPFITATAADNANVQQASRGYVSVAHDTAVVSTPVGSSGWSDAIADKVMWFSANKISSAEIHLNPPDLGPLQVRVSTQHDQASVAFTSQHAAVRDALDQALPRLREMMGSQGMHLLDVSVGGQGAQQQPQQQFARNDSAGRDASFAGLFTDDAAEATAVNVTSIDPARLLRSGVDAYA